MIRGTAMSAAMESATILPRVVWLTDRRVATSSVVAKSVIVVPRLRRF
jgi:hypothetical protein